ncbi:MAG: hypothetical protein LBT02_03075 [Rickettsiales bacterium]|jgi:alanyl-tRNA synthetase|nr:hypothetical protein [Rickettsiales bacterium]
MTENVAKPLFSGKIAFTLYDTYGFPLDLTQDILRGKGIEVDVAEFDKSMAEQKERSKWSGTGDAKNNEVYYQIKDRIQETEFLGYDKNVVMGKILAMVKDSIEVSEATAGDDVEFFVNKTSFYGEMGGQVGDSGIAMQIGENGTIQLPFSTIEISHVKQPFDKYFLHKGKVTSGKIKVGDFVNLAINTDKRNKIRANHSAVHLLEAALRKIYGDNVVQKGSFVDEDGARYDFALNKAVSKDDLKKIENIVNEIIYQKTKTLTKIMPLDEAKKTGAIALFGEKYGDLVRVLFIGEQDGEHTFNNDGSDLKNVGEALHILNGMGLKNYYSIDFCGGTHVENTGDIGVFKVVSESSIGSGIRRIEILTGLNAIQYLNKQVGTAEKTAEILETNVEGVFEKVSALNIENKEIRKELSNLKKANLSNMEFKEEKIGDIVFATIILNASPTDLKGVFIDKQNKKYSEKSVVVAIAEFDGKNTILIGVSKDLNTKYSAKNLIKEVGQGGGQDWFAMGSVEKKDGVIEKIKAILK